MLNQTSTAEQLQRNLVGQWFEHEQLLILVRTEPLSITITTITSYDIQRVLNGNWSDGGPNSEGLRL